MKKQWMRVAYISAPYKVIATTVQTMQTRDNCNFNWHQGGNGGHIPG